MSRPNAVRFDRSDVDAKLLAAIRDMRDRMLREYDDTPEYARPYRCWQEKWEVLLDGNWVRWSPAELLGARSRRLRGVARDALERLSKCDYVDVYADAGRVLYVRLTPTGEVRAMSESKTAQSDPVRP